MKYKKLRKCPKCGGKLKFYLEGNFGGTIGNFECKCGFKDRSYENSFFATNEEWKEFHEWTIKEGIMW